MIKLLIYSEKSDMQGISFGGLPVRREGTHLEWPLCKSCELPMQYLGKIATDIGLEQIFMCQNEPGCCEEWEPDSGANAVIILESSDLEHAEAPADGEAIRNCQHGAEIVEIEAENYDKARVKWQEESGLAMRQVLGQINGEPLWLQQDETPTCSGCGNKMRFVAQLEQGPDWETEMNFGGGGCAYLFDCSCNGSGKFLWQC